MDLPNFSVVLDIELPFLREVYSCGYSWSLSLHSLFVLFFNKNQMHGKYRQIRNSPYFSENKIQ
jgi:hypothetical protein